MKKIVLLAAFAVVGFSEVSCSTDDNEAVNSSVTNPIVINSNELFSRESDTISVIDTVNTTTTQTIPGPGDEPIIVPPPPTKP